MQSKTLAKVCSASKIKLPPLVLEEIEEKIEKPVQEEEKSPDPDYGDYESARMENKNLKATRNLQLPRLPQIPKAGDPSFKNIMMKKIELCKQMCDFDNPNNDKDAKIIKANALQEISNRFSNLGINSYIDEDIRVNLVQMIKTNLIRPLSKLDDISLFFSDINSFHLEDFQHTQHIYKILTFFFRDFPKYEIFDIKFMKELIPVLSSRDIRERDMIIAFMVSLIQAKNNLFNQILPSLIKIIDHHFVDIDPCGVYSALGIMKGVIKEIPSFWRVIQPMFQTHLLNLLRYDCLRVYADPLSEIFSLFYNNNSIYSKNTIELLVSIWPVSNPSKEEIMINILSSALDFPEAINNALLCHIVDIVAISIDSPSHKIAEAANRLFVQPSFTELVSKNRKTFTVKLLPHVENARTHWNEKIRSLGNESNLAILRMNPNIKSKKIQDATTDTNKTKLKGWASIARAAATKDKTINLSDKLGEFSKVYGSGGVGNGLISTPLQLNFFPIRSIESQPQIMIPNFRSTSQMMIRVN
ncbi:hypothetical protein TVAG_428220 [Trichomonas vaginalis G3]|uniref:Phosphoprotein phosphatase n=1 Tax=Trichomonas vaginalis (strain ATCC PRA-98 / G3) TaxID=412133 RepID=A2G2U9_TRIV3|nr:protein phosphatase regulator protein [Trichomonas vaginalis G3]EAX88513.1 hypothetical protein TVAG_428220 [Trichomonas vaginalis G3]KAI5538209.1 protein phosphatase regulator protein [Trichomonas vaginalis G3]|eukprot:XP_001301443.1 hypothetical protein [Trichomonas vaginalis G3]